MNVEEAVQKAQDKWASNTNWYEYHIFILGLIKEIYKDKT